MILRSARVALIGRVYHRHSFTRSTSHAAAQSEPMPRDTVLSIPQTQTGVELDLAGARGPNLCIKRCVRVCLASVCAHSL
jgi:hypothetical protein